MSIVMHRVQSGEDTAAVLEALGYQVKHSTDGYPLLEYDKQDKTLVFVIPPENCPIDGPFSEVVALAQGFYDSALVKYGPIQTVKPFEFIESMIASILSDASEFIDSKDWNDAVKSYIRDNILRPAIIGFLETKGLITEV